MAKKQIQVTLGDRKRRDWAETYKKEVGEIGDELGMEGMGRNTYQPESAESGLEPSPEDRKAQLYRALAQRMGSANERELHDVAVRLGGTRLGDYYSRVLHNRRMSILRRARMLFGHTVLFPIVWANDALLNFGRADHFNPATNSVTMFSDNPAILTHELGHAIDFNRRSRFGRWLRERGNTMDVEQAANSQSADSIRNAFKDDLIAYRALCALRRRSLPNAYATYKDYYEIPNDHPRYGDYKGDDRRYKKYEDLPYDKLYDLFADRLVPKTASFIGPLRYDILRARIAELRRRRQQEALAEDDVTFFI